MRVFKSQQFTEDLVYLHGNEDPETFASKLGTTPSTLDMLERGEIYPTGDEFRKVCEMVGKKSEDYFIETESDSIHHLIEHLEGEDKKAVEEFKERVDIMSKYELLAERAFRAEHNKTFDTERK